MLLLPSTCPADGSLYSLFDWQSGRTLPAFTIAWLMAGEGEFQTKKQHLRLEKGQVFQILPGEWHCHRPNREIVWSIAWIEFNGAIPFQWWENGAFGINPNLLKIRNEELFALQFHDLLLTVQQAPASNSHILSLMTMGIMAHLLTETGKNRSVSGSEDPVVDKAIEIIWNFSHGLINVDEVARRAGVGRRVLERRFKEVKGHGVLEEIQRCRLGRAMRLLGETRLPLKIVVVRAGFGSYEQLRKTLFKFTGMSPQSYRDSVSSTPRKHL